jgi:hypothetical protein
MLKTLRQSCRPTIGLAAIFVVSMASEASAGSTMKPGSGSCDTVCGCCSPKANESATSHA